MKACADHSQARWTAWRWHALLLIPFLLVGGLVWLMWYPEDGRHDDLRSWMRDSTRDLRGQIPSLPSLAVREVATYQPPPGQPPFLRGNLDKAKPGGASAK